MAVVQKYLPKEKYNSDKEVESHYVYISEVRDDGTILVSSWGDMYIFDDKGANWTRALKLNKAR